MEMKNQKETSNIETKKEPDKDEDEKSKTKMKFRIWVQNKIYFLNEFVMAFLDIHRVKIVAFSIMCLCCFQVNALHLVIVAILLFSITFGTSVLRCSFNVIGPYLGALFLSKMFYQTDFLPDFRQTVKCTEVNKTFQDAIKLTIFDPEWWGIIFLKKDANVASNYGGYLIVLTVMTLKTVVKTRQKIARIDAGQPSKTPTVMYPQITRSDADNSLKDCIKYLINYGFYKFGVEITLTFCVFDISYRLDAYSILYAILVAMLFLPKRQTLAILWPFFFTTLVCSIAWQYCTAVGLSKNSCIEYFWSKNSSFVIFMFLPSFKIPPDTKKTLVDFVLLLLIQRQQYVFEVERKYGDKYVGGSNKLVYTTYYSPNFVNPTPDHTKSIRSWLDIAKFIFLSSLFRITLAFAFWNGASNANILSLGYLVGAFVFLWIDYDLCLWPISKILKWWNIFLGYIVFVILLKSILQFPACVYSDFLNSKASWVVEFLSLRCGHKISENPYVYTTTSMYWDVVCFALVIFQRRNFQSYYFLHEVEDIFLVYQLQAKGAKLMDLLQEIKLKEFRTRERKTLMKIKKNMNRIKAWQKRMQSPNYKEPTDHATAVYMGDYLMFEDPEMSVLQEESSSDEFSFIEGNKLRGNKKDLSKLQKKSSKLLVNDPNRDKENISLLSSENYRDSDTESTDDEKKESKKTWDVINDIIDDVMIAIIKFLNKFSEDYRYIQKKMKAERKIQKQRKNKVADPNERVSRIVSDPLKWSKNYTDELDEYYEQNLKSNKESSFGFRREFREYGDLMEDQKKSTQTLMVGLINAISMFIMSKTELFCYIAIFFHMVFSPTLMSLPLPLMVFLWGSLTTIRPTTTFWTVLIAYTEVTVVIKTLFTNSVFPWNARYKNSFIRPEYPALFLGIHSDSRHVIDDLILLLLLFLHRHKLKTLGLWYKPREDEIIVPQNLQVYRELPSERDYKGVKGNMSLVNQRKTLTSEFSDANVSIAYFLKMATWKCTSRATAKVIYVNNKVRTKVKIKEIEGHILVTHDGRRLEPTFVFVTQIPEESLEGNVVLRVYVNDTSPESRNVLYKLSWIQHFTSLRKFFIQILVRDWRVSSDFYTLIFIFEFFNFLIIFFGYSFFKEAVENVGKDTFTLTENQVPIMYLFMMIMHFLVIIIDRILYLRKSVLGKLILYFLLVILVHFWMFIILPITTESPFDRLPVPQTYYIISCFYFLMSAYQLRVGYPLRVQGHFLCKNYGYINYYAYKGLQLIPFFNQLRILLDYTCTQSSMTMCEWIKMESIYQLVFENKCCRDADIKHPVPRGQEAPKCSKMCNGVSVLVTIIVVIWLPFIIFALFNTVAVPNLPQESTLTLHLGSFGKLLVIKAAFTDIYRFSEINYRVLQNLFKENKRVWTFLSSHDFKDVAVIRFNLEPFEPWIITEKEKNLFKGIIENKDEPLTLFLTWEIHRIPTSQIVVVAKGFSELVLNKNHPGRRQFIEAFSGNNTNIILPNFMPKFILVKNEGEAKPQPGFLSKNNNTNPYRSMKLSYIQGGNQTWWRLEEVADDPYEKEKIEKIPFQSSKFITIYTFNERNIPNILLNISKRGIIGLYLSLVLVLWTFIRRLMFKYPYIMYEDMPNADNVLKLCHDIYLARESHEFALEEDLYAKLIFLFRSPETMIKMTRSHQNIR